MFRLSTQTTLGTPDGDRIAKRMGKHFQHKVTVEWQQSGAIVHFAEGYCRLHTRDDRLTIECGADSSDDLQAITETIDRHLPQFTSGSHSPIIWRRQ